MGSRARYAVLDMAGDQSPLWELTWGAQLVERDDTLRELHPRMPVPEVRPALEELLRAGHVEVFDWEEPDAPPLRLEAALAIVADDRNWVPPAESGQARAYGVDVTASGEDEYRRERELH